MRIGIGTQLLKLRKERRLSQGEVAERIGVCQSAYCAWESDRTTPSARHYGPLAALFGIDLKELMPANLVSTLPPPHTPPLPAGSSSPALQDDLIQAQRETITLQKQRIEHLEAEKYQLQQRLIAAEKLVDGR